MNPSTQHIVVVGAGVIGLSCALRLRQAGFEVTVVDSEQPGASTSFGNAGAIALAETLPQSMPDTWRRIPHMLLNPLGPLTLQWRSLPAMLPWLLQFLWAGRPSKTQNIAQALAALLSRAQADTLALAHDIQATSQVRQHGAVVVYDTAAHSQADQAAWQWRARLGVESTELSHSDLHQRMPGLNPNIACGRWVPNWMHVDDPYAFSLSLERQARALGVRFETGRVTGFWPNGYAPQKRNRQAVAGVQLHSQRFIAANQVLLATGVWSQQLLRSLNFYLPMQAERGYHAELPNANVDLPHFVLNHSDSFVILPKPNGALRLAGTVELANLQAPAHWPRAHMLVRQAQQLFPQLLQPEATQQAQYWMGARPSLPDSLPAMGRLPHHPNVLLACGHGHLGLTLAATTAAYITELASDANTSPAHASYRPERFTIF